MHRWYVYLDKVFGVSMTNGKTVIYKTLADQVVFAPLAIVAFFAYTSTFDFGVDDDGGGGVGVGVVGGVGDDASEIGDNGGGKIDKNVLSTKRSTSLTLQTSLSLSSKKVPIPSKWIILVDDILILANEDGCIIIFATQ